MPSAAVTVASMTLRPRASFTSAPAASMALPFNVALTLASASVALNARVR